MSFNQPKQFVQDRIRIQLEDFNVETVLNEIRLNYTHVGASVLFVGTVRDMNDNKEVVKMHLECYHKLAIKALTAIRNDAIKRWHLVDCLIIHRIGELLPQDKIVLVVTLSQHRGDAFQACEFIMDYLKVEAPFWKNEQGKFTSKWVESQAKDNLALNKWHSK